MAYTLRVFDSVAEIERSDWDDVWRSSGSPTFLDLRFVAAVDAAMRSTCRFSYVIAYDEAGRPVACAGLTATEVDLTDLGDPRFARIVKRGPRFLSRLTTLKVLFCSLPGSPGDRSIAIAPCAASVEVLAELDRLMIRMANDAGLHAVVFKEFGPDDLAWMEPATRLGYTRIEVPPMHLLDPGFDDFAQYRVALRKKFRQSITRSTRKLVAAGIVTETLTDPADILEAYTPDVHELYCEVVRRSDVRVEILPIAYCRELVRHMAGAVELVTLRKDGHILAFAWCVCDETTYHMMYGGFDQQRNREHDLYFNMAYASLDRAFRKRVSRIHVGQTSTDFKSRMGCHSEPRYSYVKGVGFLMSRLFRWGSDLLVAKKPAKPPSHIFKGRTRVAPERALRAGGGPDRSAPG